MAEVQIIAIPRKTIPWLEVPARVREFMKWGGTVFFFIGSATISVFPSLSLLWWPFLLFAFGHCLWALAGVLMRDRAVITLNVMYLPFDIFAIFTRF